MAHSFGLGKRACSKLSWAFMLINFASARCRPPGISWVELHQQIPGLENAADNKLGGDLQHSA